MTKLAQEYPASLCWSWSVVAAIDVWQESVFTSPMVISRTGRHFQPTFCMKAEGSRKRPLGTTYERPPHKQARFGALAVAAGHQTRSSRVQPLISQEVEPGVAVSWMLSEPNPLLQPPADFPAEVTEYLKWIAQNADCVNKHRYARLKHWKRRAHELRQESLREIGQIPDADLRRLYLRNKAPEEIKNFDFFHCALFREMAQHVKASDAKVVDELIKGMFLAGSVAKSDVWPAKPQEPVLTTEEWDH